jgi:hypothetical protein
LPSAAGRPSQVKGVFPGRGNVGEPGRNLRCAQHSGIEWYGSDPAALTAFQSVLNLFGVLGVGNEQDKVASNFVAVFPLSMMRVRPFDSVVSNPPTRRTVKGLSRQTACIDGTACCRVVLPNTLPSTAIRAGRRHNREDFARRHQDDQPPFGPGHIQIVPDLGAVVLDGLWAWLNIALPVDDDLRFSIKPKTDGVRDASGRLFKVVDKRGGIDRKLWRKGRP